MLSDNYFVNGFMIQLITVLFTVKPATLKIMKKKEMKNTACVVPSKLE